MRVLVACEFSEVVKYSFRKKGHDAWSCDLLPGEQGGAYHIVGDARKEIRKGWDLLIAFVPCFNLCVSGARWFTDKMDEQEKSVGFFLRFVNAPIRKIAIENPIGIMSSWFRKPDQIIQPWQFGHGETKATCLWLKNLPKLVPTNIVEGREAKVHKCPPGPERWKIRSRTYQGIADAMAEQWSTPPDRG